MYTPLSIFIETQTMRSQRNSPKEDNPTLKKDGYRLLTIKDIMHIRNSGMIEVEFEEAPRSINIDLDFLFERAKVENLSVGDQIFIKGTKGNADHLLLWGDNKIEDIKIASRNHMKSILRLIK